MFVHNSVYKYGVVAFPATREIRNVRLADVNHGKVCSLSGTDARHQNIKSSTTHLIFDAMATLAQDNHGGPSLDHLGTLIAGISSLSQSCARRLCAAVE